MDFNEGVTIKDDMDPEPTLEVQGADKVDFATPGTYVVTYLAKDRSETRQRLSERSK